jgi:hypothetical protein
MRRLVFLVGLLAVGLVAAIAPPSIPSEAQASCGYPTGFCITNPAFLAYYQSRGEHATLGYPVSREFTLDGFQVQFFQRVVLQLNRGSVERLNVLDPGIMPLTRANQSIFPPNDPSLAAAAPKVGSSDYAQRVVEFVGAVSPEFGNGLPVRFYSTFNSAVPVPGGIDPNIQTLLNLEIWGVPTSHPAFDPGNQGFVYQRFQRGIMHFRTVCNCTEGILIGDYFKSVITGRNLPFDLDVDMRNSRFYRQYNSAAPNWVARPNELILTNLAHAFEPGLGTPPPPPPTLPPASTSTPTATPTATPIADAIPSVSIQLDDPNIVLGQSVDVTLIATDDKGLKRILFEGDADEDDNDNDSNDDPEIDKERRFDCDNRTECANILTITPTRVGRYILTARARDSADQFGESTVDLRVREGPTPTPTATPTSTPKP